MQMRCCSIFLCLAAALAAGAQAPADLPASAQSQLPALTGIYRHLHAHPELSHHEEQTAAFVAAELRKLGYTVTEHIGRYEDGSPAFGIVGIFENGKGPRVLLRTELDALPVEEKTGLDFASHVRSVNAQGQDVGVMHACGHDLHMTAMLGAARELAARRSAWHGTVMIVGQPSEETIDGSRAMLADHFYERFGTPDYIVAEHDTNDVPAGSVALKAGPLMASATSIEVKFHGIGAHGSAPQSGKDPIVLAAEFVLVGQTIVSRQIDPQDPAVMTIGTIHGGTKNNIIPEEVSLGISLRTFSMPLRDKIVEDLRREAEGLAAGYGIPAALKPTVTIYESTPPTINDAALAARLEGVFAAALGKDHVLPTPAVMASEDVGAFSLDGKIPAVMFWLGAADPTRLNEARKAGTSLPSPHSPLFAPAYTQAISTGVTAMTAAAINLLQPR